ncbi:MULTISPECIES: EF-hand domain-containing protein [unclassified Chelatococcus]|uniref:EF-hand domain-containing protein n=1 Tax=unclassified Chelatococcus TaxID=2638111 RepID=UPI0002FBBACB|nr:MULTISPECIES: EF-hand domain-containing protein [unclassified Chelatococcus]
MIRPSCAILLVLAFSSGALAQTQDERFAEIDRNGDGVITYEEHAAADEAELRAIDADGNGTLTVKEYAAWLAADQDFPAPVALSVARCFFRGIDADGDGKLSREELRTYNDRVFKWLAGDDGQMTLAESKRTPPPDIVPTPVCD